MPLCSHAEDASDERVEAVYNSPESRRMFSLGLGLKRHTISFISQDENSTDDVEFVPNNPLLINLHLVYGDLEYEVEFEDSSGTGIKKAKGESDYLFASFGYDHRTAANRPPLELDVFYQFNKGFFIDHQRELEGSYFTFPEMRSTNYGFRFGRLLTETVADVYKEYPRDEYVEYKRHVDLNENNPVVLRYGEPSGFTTSWYLLLDILKVEGVPSDQAVLSRIKNSYLLSFERAKFTTLSGVIYMDAYTTLESFFADLTIGLGAGIISEEYTRLDMKHTSSEGLELASLGINMGFFQRKGIFGLSAYADTGWTDVENSELFFMSEEYSIYYSSTFELHFVS